MDQTQDPGGTGVAYYARSYAFGHLFAFLIGSTPGSRRDLEHLFSSQMPINLRGALPSRAGCLYGPERFDLWLLDLHGRRPTCRKRYTMPPFLLDILKNIFMRPGIIQTNVYTFFRGMIYDFSLAGSLVFLFICGVAFNYMYRTMLLRKYAPLSQGMYVFFAGYLYTSSFISLTIWANVYASTVLTIAFMWLLSRLRRGPRRRPAPLASRSWPGEGARREAGDRSDPPPLGSAPIRLTLLALVCWVCWVVPLDIYSRAGG